MSCVIDIAECQCECHRVAGIVHCFPCCDKPSKEDTNIGICTICAARSGEPHSGWCAAGENGPYHEGE